MFLVGGRSTLDWLALPNGVPRAIRLGRAPQVVQANAVQEGLEWNTRRPKNPGGLSHREVDVLRLAARGLTTQEIADRLFISPKTAGHHIQHIYNKITVSARAASALWAMQNAVIQ